MNKPLLTCKTFAQLRKEYGVSHPTMKKLLKKVPDLVVDNRELKEFTPKEVAMIYRHLGVSGELFEE